MFEKRKTQKKRFEKRYSYYYNYLSFIYLVLFFFFFVLLLLCIVFYIPFLIQVICCLRESELLNAAGIQFYLTILLICPMWAIS